MVVGPLKYFMKKRNNNNYITMVIIMHNFFYKQLHFKSQPGVDSEILENEAESCLAVAYQK